MHIAKKAEYAQALEAKLHEEAAEFLENPSVEEAADVLEVMRAICTLHHIDMDSLEAARKSKADKRGGFEKRIILDDVRSNE